MTRLPGCRRLLTAVLLLGALMVVPAAAAHVTYLTDDEAYVITVGQQGEPVYTFQRTNLDLIIRENTDERAEVGGVHETLTAVLIGPGGEELEGELSPQHGATGRYQFADGYTLTQPGVYTLRLTGTIGESTVDRVYDLPHAIHSQSEVMFPDRGLDDLRALNARVADLETRLMQAETQAADNGEAPAPGLALVALLVLGLALLARRRAQL
jgi:MYXO-CTERM domain-containing protein